MNASILTTAFIYAGLIELSLVHRLALVGSTSQLANVSPSREHPSNYHYLKHA